MDTETVNAVLFEPIQDRNHPDLIGRIYLSKGERGENFHDDCERNLFATCTVWTKPTHRPHGKRPILNFGPPTKMVNGCHCGEIELDIAPFTNAVRLAIKNPNTWESAE